MISLEWEHHSPESTIQFDPSLTIVTEAKTVDRRLVKEPSMVSAALASIVTMFTVLTFFFIVYCLPVIPTAVGKVIVKMPNAASHKIMSSEDKAV